MNKIDESNFVLFAAQCYDNQQCIDETEFFDDLKRFKYLKRLFNKYKEGYQNIVDKVTSLREEYMLMRNNTEAVKEIQRRNVELREEMKNYGLNFLMQYPETNFSLMLLESITQQKEFDAKLANEILIKIPKSLLKNKYNIDKVQKINFNINNVLNQVKIEIGAIAPDFTAPDPDGNSITLSKALGKITILDFWALG